MAELGEEQRSRLVETLALRFFPGQTLDVSGGGDTPTQGP